MAVGKAEEITLDTVVHRLGGGTIENLRLSPIDAALTPPGISVLVGGTAQAAAAQMRQAFPRSRKWQETHAVGITTVAALHQASFEIIPDPTARFPNHARLIHPDGVAGFNDVNVTRLAQKFENVEC